MAATLTDERNQAPDPMAAVGGALAATITPGMIEKLSVMAERSATAVDILISPEVMGLLEQLRKTAPALTHAMQRVDGLSRSGALDTLIDLAEVLHAARVTMSDGMIAKLAQNGEMLIGLMDTLQASGLAEKAPALLQAANAAKAEAAADKSALGPFALLRTLKEEELQFVLKFMLAFARKAPGAMASDQ